MSRARRPGRAVVLLLALGVLLALLGGCRRQRSEEPRSRYAPPRNAVEAAYAWPGELLEFNDEHGDRVLRLRQRALTTRVLGPDLVPLGLVRDLDGSLTLTRRDGTPAYVLVPGEEEERDQGQGPSEGWTLHELTQAPQDDQAAPSRLLPEPGRLLGRLVPDEERAGAWTLQDDRDSPILTLVPETPQDDGGDRGEGGDDGDDGEEGAADQTPAPSWVATFFAPETGQQQRWRLVEARHGGQRVIEARRLHGDDPQGDELALRVPSRTLAPPQLAPILIQRFDPLVRAGLLMALAERRR